MHISALYIYPIKGCRGIAVNSAAVHDIGLAMREYYTTGRAVSPERLRELKQAEPAI